MYSLKMSQDLSGAELKKRIAEILKDADLETTSAKKASPFVSKLIDGHKS